MNALALTGAYGFWDGGCGVAVIWAITEVFEGKFDVAFVSDIYAVKNFDTDLYGPFS